MTTTVIGTIIAIALIVAFISISCSAAAAQSRFEKKGRFPHSPGRRANG